MRRARPDRPRDQRTGRADRRRRRRTARRVRPPRPRADLGEAPAARLDVPGHPQAARPPAVPLTPVHRRRVSGQKGRIMRGMFDAPSSSSGVKIPDFDGQLLLITPTGHATDITTAYGPADAVTATIAVLDGNGAGEEHTGVRIFQKALQGQLRPKVGTGRMVLGRLGRGIAKPGQSAPWLLADPTEADKQTARDYLARANSAPF